MGTYCTCANEYAQEFTNQFDFGEKENILTGIKTKFENYNTSEFISKEEFNKLLSSFPDFNEIKTQFEEFSQNQTDQKDQITSPVSDPQSKVTSNQETNIIEIIEPIKFCGDDDQYSVYNYNINKEYNFTGKGYHINNNFLYYGNIENNKSNGKGILIDRNGNYLYGNWENGKCTGKGVLKIKNLLEYEGDFVNSIKQGKGIEKYSDGSIYEGEFKENKKNGKGKVTLSNGQIYEGEFSDDLYEGQGTYKWPSESREYSGHFTKGIIDGKGINKYADGSKYEGNYKKGIKHGYGVYTWPNGKTCKGNWINNKLHGNAIFEEGDKKFHITFRFGKIISASEVDEKKNVIFGVENIINKENIDNIEKYKCPFCEKLLCNPYKCCNCNKNYCLACIKLEGEENKYKKCTCGEDKYEINGELNEDLVKNIKINCDVCKTELNYELAINHIHQG